MRLDDMNESNERYPQVCHIRQDRRDLWTVIPPAFGHQGQLQCAATVQRSTLEEAKAHAAQSRWRVGSVTTITPEQAAEREAHDQRTRLL